MALTKLDVTVQVTNSIDLRNYVGGGTDNLNCGLVLRPSFPMGDGVLLYYWDAASTATDDAPTTDAIGGVWANVVDPTSGGTGRWRLASSSLNMPLNANANWNATSGPAKVLNKPYVPALVQSTRTNTNSSGVLTWTFPIAYPSGVTPTIGVTPQDNTSGLIISHKITAVSNTSVTIEVSRSSAVTVLGISVLGVSSAAATLLHVTAQSPS